MVSHLLHVYLCFSHAYSVLYAYTVVFNTPMRIKQRAYTRNYIASVNLNTYALCRKPRRPQLLCEVAVCDCVYVCFSHSYVATCAQSLDSNTPLRTKQCEGTGYTNICVLLSTQALLRKQRTHHNLGICVCFSHSVLLLYAKKVVSNPPTGIITRAVAQYTNKCVLFLTHAMLRKRRTHHMFQVCVCFSHVYLSMYAKMVF